MVEPVPAADELMANELPQCGMHGQDKKMPCLRIKKMIECLGSVGLSQKGSRARREVR